MVKAESSPLESYLTDLRPQLSSATDRFIKRWRSSPGYAESPDLQSDIDTYAQLLKGGKKIRGSLVVLGFENSDGADRLRSGALTSAVGYELLHNAFLVHDDIEDNSPLRRGVPTAHERYRAEARVGDDKQYGIAVAVNAGNIGATRALESVWNIDNYSSRIARAQRWLIEVMDVTLQGQRRDLSYRTLPSLTADEVYTICNQKTAFYTVTGPLNLGSILAGAPKKRLNTQSIFGENLGVAFQMIDDHLGLYGDESVTGKPVGSDISEAKKTLHFVEAYRLGSEQDRELLIELWGKKDLSQTEVTQVQDLVDRMGVKDSVIHQASALAEQARDILPQMTDKPMIKSVLEDLIDFVVYRSY